MRSSCGWAGAGAEREVGMRWRAYAQIVASLDAQEERRDDLLFPGLARLLAKHVTEDADSNVSEDSWS